jgi:hypothetical protein
MPVFDDQPISGDKEAVEGKSDPLWIFSHDNNVLN